MKVKKRLLSILLTVLLIMTSGLTYASENTPVIDKTAKSITRMNDLSLFSYGPEYRDLIVNREMFSRAIVIASGNGGIAELTRGYSEIPDVSTDNEFSHYINTAVSKRIMDIIMESNNFYPKKEMDFSEACTVMVRALGYYTLEPKDTRHRYYINKASELGIIKDLSLSPWEPLTLGTVSVMFEGLFNAKAANAGEKKFYEQSGLFTELLVINNSQAKEELANNQIETDKGVVFTDLDKNSLELGYKYRVKLEDSKLVKVYTKLNLLDSFVVDDKFDSDKLPRNIIYYLNGVKKSYDDIRSSLMRNSTVLLAYDDDNAKYEYGVIYNPIYSEPVIAKNNGFIVNLGDIQSNNNIIDEYGQELDRMQINDGAIVYEVKDVFGKSSYVQVLDERIEGRITSIDINYINRRVIEVDYKRYELSNSIDISKLLTFDIEDKVSILLGHDGKVLDVNKIQYKSGPFIQCIIIGNNLTTNKVGEEQVLTSQGAYFFLDGMKLEVGSTYKVVIDEGTIVKAEKIEKSNRKFSVEKYLDNTITYLDNGKTKKMILPKLQAYYHNGSKVDYDNLKDIIKEGSTLILVKNPENIGYEYGIIVDAVYNYPDIIKDAKGNIEIREGIVLGNHLTMDNLSKNQVLTSNGVYYYLSSINLHLSSMYRIVTDGDTIVKVDREQRGSKSLVVERFLEDRIIYNDGTGIQQIVLPRLSAYYYQGEKVDYDTVKSAIKVNTTVILVQNEYNTGYEYGVVFDPKYSVPKINGSADFVFDSRYNFKDVLYTITDIYGNNSKTIDIDNKIIGQITALLPNKTYPTAIQVGGKNYEISKYYDFSQNIFLHVGSRVTLVLGIDGKIIDIY